MRVATVIQARMASSRLPGKVLRPLAGAPLLQRLIERVSRSKRTAALVIATSDQPQNDAIADLCQGLGVSVFRGSETDVLARMVGAAETVRADILVRLTADNPLVDGALIDDLLDGFLPQVPPLAYTNNVDNSGFPYGLFVEAATMWALYGAMTSKDPMDREHVTRFLRMQPELFPTYVLKSPLALEHSSVTVDTEDDFTTVARLFESLSQSKPNFTYHDVITALAEPSQAEPMPAVMKTRESG